MSYAIFPRTWDNDQIRVKFAHLEEKMAFQSVLERLGERIKQNNPREKTIEDFKFDTTLEREVARDNLTQLCHVLGLSTIQFGDRKITVYPCAKRSS